MLRASAGGADGLSPPISGDDVAVGAFASEFAAGFAAAFGRETGGGGDTAVVEA
jgi:hypothetical protein